MPSVKIKTTLFAMLLLCIYPMQSIARESSTDVNEQKIDEQKDKNTVVHDPNDKNESPETTNADIEPSPNSEDKNNVSPGNNDKKEDTSSSSSQKTSVEETSLSDQELAELNAALAEDNKTRNEDKKESSLSNYKSPVASAIQSMNPDMAVILDVAGAYFTNDNNLQTGGHDPTKSGFNLQQLEMSLAASVDPFFRFDANLVFSLFGVEVEEAYATTLALPWGLQARAGQFLTRFGRINNTHPHTWDFVDQPFAIGKFFGSEGNRNLGAEISMLMPLPWYVEIVTSAMGPYGSATNRSYFGSSDRDLSSPADLVYTIAIKQFFTPLDRFSIFFGLSAQLGPLPTGYDNRADIYGTDLTMKYKFDADTSLAFQAEALFRLRQYPHRLLFDAAGYAQLIWQIDKQWALGTRTEVGTGIDDDPLDPEWKTTRARYSVQGTYFPSHFSRLRVQVSIDDPRWRDEPIFATFLALEVVVGTHAAHQY